MGCGGSTAAGDPKSGGSSKGAYKCKSLQYFVMSDSDSIVGASFFSFNFCLSTELFGYRLKKEPKHVDMKSKQVFV